MRTDLGNVLRAISDAIPGDRLSEGVLIVPKRVQSVLLTHAGRIEPPYTITPVNSRVIRAAHPPACAGAGAHGRGARHAAKVRDAAADGAHICLAKVVAKLDLATGESRRWRQWGWATRDVAELEVGVDAFGLGHNLFDSAVQNFDLAGGHLDGPGDGHDSVAGDTRVRNGGEGGREGGGEGEEES